VRQGRGRRALDLAPPPHLTMRDAPQLGVDLDQELVLGRPVPGTRAPQELGDAALLLARALRSFRDS